MQVPANLVPEMLSTARYASSSLLLVQAAGGNNSIKDVERNQLWVKASGVRLADVTEHKGMVPLRNSVIRSVVQNGDFESLPRSISHERSIRLTGEAVLDRTKGRPSLETGFHALLGDVVLHLHPVYVNAITCMEKGAEFLARLAPLPFSWVEYAAPGQELAVKVDKAIQGRNVRSETVCVALENHGFIASGQTSDDVIRATEAFLRVGQSVFGELSPDLYTPQPSPEGLEGAGNHLCSLLRERWGNESYLVRAARFGAFKRYACEPMVWNNPGPLVPDDVIFAGKGICVSALSGLRDFVDRLERPPEKLALAVEGLGTILLARNEGLLVAMEETLLAHALVRILVARQGCVHPLVASEVEYLQNMESEKYRISISSKGSA